MAEEQKDTITSRPAFLEAAPRNSNALPEGSPANESPADAQAWYNFFPPRAA